MSNPSPKAHLYRLGILLVLFVIGFLLVKAWATPDSWDYVNWYRTDALIEAQQQPLIFGGNESCQACHQPALKKLNKFSHRTLSCESCHGALADHVRLEKKVADAKVDKSRWQCQNCHFEQINRPRGFPQFSKQGEIGKSIRKHRDLDEETPCLKCHDAHDPTP
jgi:hypothetical protein